MNGYQRINTVLDGGWPDRRPVMLHNFMPAAREAGMTQAQYRSSPENIARAHIEAAEKYELDGVLIDVDTSTTASALGVPTKYPEDDPAVCHRGNVETLEAVDDLQPVDLSKSERVMTWIEACRLVKQHFGDHKFVRGNCDQLPFSVACMMRSVGTWMLDLTNEEEEERVFKLLDYALEACLQFVNLMAETGVDMMSHGDSPAGPEMISPAMYRKFALPYQQRVVHRIHEHGKPCLIHICGNTERILETLPATGADAFELDYKTDAQEILRVIGPRAVLSGNLDPSGVLARGTPELVTEKTRDLLDIYRDCPHLIVCSGCALPPASPEATIRAMISTARET